MSALLPTAMKRLALTANASALGDARIDGVDLGVEDDEIGVRPIGSGRGARSDPGGDSRA